MRGPDLEKLAIMSLVKQLRRNTLYANSLFVFIVEAAPANSASYIERYLRKDKTGEIGPYVLLAERKGYMEGVPKGKRETEEYFYQLQEKLTENYLAYGKHIITFQEEEPANVRRELEEMIRNFRLEDRTPDREHGEHVYHLTAKVSGASDDMLMALVMILHWRTEFLSNDKYSESHAYMRRQRDVDFTL